ncbi:hypothetical protein [Nocardioides sp.]|uniref:hypothetical protein n=1 Tax=Nocardioides sp. TaxID=35761 RepID=UPI0027327A1C|nr:hypothetical protein [Nocardioides sp.]MDP3890695.1 hypothetical protein [Nocardioides sp.]
MTGVAEPVPPLLHRRLRAEILAFKASEARRRFPVVVHVGVPGRPHEGFAEHPGSHLDHALRTEIVGALVQRVDVTEPPVTWVTRPGGLDLHESDQAWLAAALAAYAEEGLPLTMVVLTRSGWYDPRSGTRRTWVRLRPRS